MPENENIFAVSCHGLPFHFDDKAGEPSSGRRREQPVHQKPVRLAISGELTIAEAVARSPTGTMLIVDLKPIMDRVTARLVTLP